MRLASSDIGDILARRNALWQGTVVSDTGPVPEAIRQEVVSAYPVDAEGLPAQLDRIAQLAARLCSAPVGLVSLVETDRQRFIGRSGTELCETPREQSFCAHAMLEREAMVIADAREDRRFSANPLVVGAPFIRFYAGQPLVSREGVPLGSLCVIDSVARPGLTHDQLHALETLAQAVMALLERGRTEQSSGHVIARSRTEIAELQQRFQVLADAMPQLVWSTDHNGMADYFNRVWCEFTGAPAEASYGDHWTGFLHPDDRAAASACWAQAVDSGEAYEVEYRLLHHTGEYRWVLARGVPMHSGDNAIARWIGTCTDIDEQKADAERLDVLSRELNHRINNIFAVIGGLVAMTIRNKPDFKAPGAELRERILALGRAHDFVRSRGGRPVLHPHGKLSGLLKTLLAPYQDDTNRRIVIGGDDAAIDDRSATPLALVFHELATNAAKYGALSDDTGRIEIDIAAGDEITLTWRESGGPRVLSPGESGFGSSLIEMSIVRQLGGRLVYDWRDEGLCVTAHVPSHVLAR